MRISDWSSDVCSSDLQDQLLEERNAPSAGLPRAGRANPAGALALVHQVCSSGRHRITAGVSAVSSANGRSIEHAALGPQPVQPAIELHGAALAEMALEDLALVRLEENTSALQSLMRMSYAVV